jgi:hypothetical protein
MVWIAIEWCLFGYMFGVNMGRIGVEGIFMPLGIAVLFGAMGMVGLGALIWKGAKRGQYAPLVGVAAVSLVLVVAACWGLDDRGPDVSGNAVLFGGAYFLVSLAAACIGLLVSRMVRLNAVRANAEALRNEALRNALLQPMSEDLLKQLTSKS